MEAHVDVSSGDEARDQAAQEAAKTRKRAGIPEVDPDALPSTVVPKILIPDLT